jgi:hypothetical protein
VVPGSDLARQPEVAGAFLAASSGDDFDALLEVPGQTSCSWPAAR